MRHIEESQHDIQGRGHILSVCRQYSMTYRGHTVCTHTCLYAYIQYDIQGTHTICLHTFSVTYSGHILSVCMHTESPPHVNTHEVCIPCVSLAVCATHTNKDIQVITYLTYSTYLMCDPQIHSAHLSHTLLEWGGRGHAGAAYCHHERDLEFRI